MKRWTIFGAEKQMLDQETERWQFLAKAAEGGKGKEKEKRMSDKLKMMFPQSETNDRRNSQKGERKAISNRAVR
ncbi:hypothetical protein SESBI_27197 [Sesbania bispinosa]|nr:hypothetical protein SESBI_27197 [Sesbania bispinosa]